MSTVEVSLEDLQIVFDTAVNSMDFGSGFLDTEEVNALREVAKVLGVPPIKATPEEFYDMFYEDYLTPWRSFQVKEERYAAMNREDEWVRQKEEAGL